MSAAPVNGHDHDRNRHYAAHVTRSLQEDYRLRTDEADRAVGLYLRRKAGWATPDQAAFEAYRWWTATVAPTVVLAREAEQRVHARMAASTDLELLSEPRDTETVLLSEDAYLTRADYVEADLAAAESALSLIRQQGRRGGFTGEHVELAGHLKQMLDESSLWDTIVPDDTITVDDITPTLEPALRPDTVRPVDDWDDMIVIDAAFAGTTITVMRPPRAVQSSSYVFMTLEPGKRSIMQAADLTTMGRIAAGDRQPEPSLADEYERLGKQVRNHLIGLIDAVADARELRTEQEGRRLQAANASLGSTVGVAYERRQPTRGTGR